MSNNIREININLNTATRDDSPLSQPTWLLGIPLTLKHHRSYFRVMVRSISIPYFAIYNIVGQYFNYRYATGDPWTTYIVPDGTYELNDILGLFFPVTGLNAVQSIITGKVTFSDPSIPNVNKYKTWLQLSPDLAQFCGVGTAEFMVSSHLPLISSYTAPNVALTSLAKSVYVNCHLNANDNWDAIRRSFHESRTIARVGVANTYIRSGIDYEFQSPVFSDLSDRVISSISLSLSSEQYAVINPNLDWSITLSIIECLKPLIEEEASALGTVDSLSMEDLKIEDSDLSGFTDLDAQDTMFTEAARKLKTKRMGVK